MSCRVSPGGESLPFVRSIFAYSFCCRFIILLDSGPEGQGLSPYACGGTEHYSIERRVLLRSSCDVTVDGNLL